MSKRFLAASAAVITSLMSVPVMALEPVKYVPNTEEGLSFIRIDPNYNVIGINNLTGKQITHLDIVWGDLTDYEVYLLSMNGDGVAYSKDVEAGGELQLGPSQSDILNEDKMSGMVTPSMDQTGMLNYYYEVEGGEVYRGRIDYTACRNWEGMRSGIECRRYETAEGIEYRPYDSSEREWVYTGELTKWVPGAGDWPTEVDGGSSDGGSDGSGSSDGPDSGSDEEAAENNSGAAEANGNSAEVNAQNSSAKTARVGFTVKANESTSGKTETVVTDNVSALYEQSNNNVSAEKNRSSDSEVEVPELGKEQGVSGWRIALICALGAAILIATGWFLFFMKRKKSNNKEEEK